jgi:hypothetical protein
VVWVPYTDEQRDQMGQLADLFALISGVYQTAASDAMWMPAAGSTAARDRTEILARPELGDGVELLMSGLCHDFSYAAYLQLGALEAMYRANEVLLSSAVLTRCVVEHSARISWILGSPGGESLEHRLARAMLEEIAGANRRKRLRDIWSARVIRITAT